MFSTLGVELPEAAVDVGANRVDEGLDRVRVDLVARRVHGLEDGVADALGVELDDRAGSLDDSCGQHASFP